ncbi:DUF805 domain-containing protein [Nicoliella lavandulae]|uniref:DUF805 domain-containing protein n=1 Tax=Nicoliella lavandulae TaxID=3082954 RepID=A0ABU8SM82_9LACO
MKYCVKCGKQIPDSAKFCTYCGAEQNGSTAQNVTINNYGTNNGSKEVIGSSNPVNMVQAFKLFWGRYADFGGTSSRSEYWYWILWQTIVTIIALVFVLPTVSSENGGSAFSGIITILTIAIIIWYVASIIPTFAITARRLRDMGSSTTAIILLLIGECIPFLNFFIEIAVFIMTLMPSVKQN